MNKLERIDEFFKPSKLVSNLNKLPLGAILSYKEICLLLEEREVSGNSRISQAEEWSAYMVLEKVGRKFLIRQVFSPADRDISKLFNKDDTHIVNSALLLQEFLVERHLGAEPTEREGIYEMNLFRKDLASICGYLPESYYNYRTALSKGSIEGYIAPFLQMFLESTVRTEVCKTLDRVLASLEKRKLLLVTKKYIGVKSMSHRELTNAEVVEYNGVLIKYANKVNKGKLERLNTKTKEFRNMLADVGLDFINVFTAFGITFKVETLQGNLEREYKELAIKGNNSHFKKRVRDVASGVEKKMLDGALVKGSFLANAFYSFKTMEDVDWMLEEWLTCGSISEDSYEQ